MTCTQLHVSSNVDALTGPVCRADPPTGSTVPVSRAKTTRRDDSILVFWHHAIETKIFFVQVSALKGAACLMATAHNTGSHQRETPGPGTAHKPQPRRAVPHPHQGPSRRSCSAAHAIHTPYAWSAAGEVVVHASGGAAAAPEHGPRLDELN